MKSVKMKSKQQSEMGVNTCIYNIGKELIPILCKQNSKKRRQINRNV